MNKSYTIKPTDSEIEILQFIRQHGPSSVHFINDELNRRKQVGKTTTLKIMQIMTEKGLLERKEEGRKPIYSAAIQEQEIQNLLQGKFLETTFEVSAMKLVMQALGNHKASPTELEELKAEIQQEMEHFRQYEMQQMQEELRQWQQDLREDVDMVTFGQVTHLDTINLQ